MPTEYLLDASALLAFILEESGSDYVRGKLDTASISTVNLIEVVTRLIQRGVSEQVAWTTLVDLPLEVISVNQEVARHACNLARFSRSHALSLADRVCLGTARSRNLLVLTADREWAKLDTGVKILLIR